MIELSNVTPSGNSAITYKENRVIWNYPSVANNEWIETSVGPLEHPEIYRIVRSIKDLPGVESIGYEVVAGFPEQSYIILQAFELQENKE